MAISKKTIEIQRDLQDVPRMTLASIAGKHGVSTSYVHKVKQQMTLRPPRLTDANLAELISSENLEFIEAMSEANGTSFVATIEAMVDSARTKAAGE